MLERYIDTNLKTYDELLGHYKIKVPENFNFAFDIVDEWARMQPDKTALVWCDDTGASRIFTFSDLKKLSNQAANVFAAQGIGRGDAVMLVLKRRYEYWICALALCKLGALMIPASYLLTKKDIEYRVQSADIKMILSVSDPELLQAIEAAQPQCPTLHTRATLWNVPEGWLDFTKTLNSAPEHFERATGENAQQNDDPMLIYFTSGTTGMPKMVLHDFTYPLGHVPAAHYWHQTGPDDLHITVADTGWAKCSWGKIYGQWVCGTAQFVYDMEKFVPLKLAEKISKYKVTSFCAPPTIYRFLIKEHLSQFDFSALKHASTAGEPLNPEVFHQFKQQFGVEIRESFGQSETTPIIGTFTGIQCVPGSMGMPSFAYDVELLNEDDEPCDVGEEGQIVINVKNGRPPGLFRGYYRDPEKTGAVWYNDRYYTGDMAWKDEKGYWYFIGRADDVIKSSGYRIGPFEVESALMEHPCVLECAISAVPDPVRGQIVKATVVLVSSYTPSEALKKELQDHVKRVTAPYKYPRIIEFVDELPKTISGKIRRKEIRDKDAQRKL